MGFENGMTADDGSTFLRVKTANRPAAKRYTIVNLRPVNKGGYSSASSINHFGQVAGHGAAEAKVVTRAFAWSYEQGLVADLGSIYGGDSFSTSINDKGVIVGYTTTPENSLRAYLLGQGQMYDLGLLASTQYEEAFSVATDINENGQIVGHSHNDANQVHAFLWEYDKGMVDLGSLGGDQSYAYAINDSGRVVGWSQVPDKASYRGFVWTADDGMNDLGGFPSQPTVAYSINAFGVICGAASGTQLGNVLHAAIWQPNNVLQLGTFGGFAFSACHSINDVGQSVGWAYPSSHSEMKYGRAFIWDSTRGLQDLNYLIDVDSGWVLHKAMGINNNGDIIGCGTFDGKLQAFLLSPVDYARDVTKYVDVSGLSMIKNQKTGITYRTLLIKNVSHKPITGPLHLVFRDLTPGVEILGASGEIDDCPFRTLKFNELAPSTNTSTTVQFSNPSNLIINYDIETYSGSF